MGADEAEVAASVVVGTYYIVRKMVGHLVSHGLAAPSVLGSRLPDCCRRSDLVVEIGFGLGNAVAAVAVYSRIHIHLSLHHEPHSRSWRLQSHVGSDFSKRGAGKLRY